MECGLMCSLFLFPGCLGVDGGPESDDEDLGHMESAAYMKTGSQWEHPESISVCWANGYIRDKDRYAVERKIVENVVRREFGNRREFWLNFVGWQRCQRNSTVGTDLDTVAIHVTDEKPRAGVGENGAKELGIELNVRFLDKRPPYCSETIHKNKNEMRRCIESMAVHEFLHVAGFGHEQDRPDTPPNLTYPRDPDVKPGSEMVGEWDWDSESNYNNSNTDGVLSPLDVLGLHILYVASRPHEDGTQKLVRLYKDSFGRGSYSRFGVGRYSSQRKEFSIGNDSVSSVSVPKTFTLVLCDRMSTTGGPDGQCVKYSQDVKLLGGMNDRASYAEVLRAVVLKDDAGYSRSFSAGAYLAGDPEFGELRKTRSKMKDFSSSRLKRIRIFKERYVSAASITVPPTCVAEVCSDRNCASVGSAQGSISPDILGWLTKLTVRSVVEVYGEAYFGGTQKSLNPLATHYFASGVKSLRIPPGLSVDVCVQPEWGESDVLERGEETRTEHHPYTRCQSITGDFGGTPYLGDRFVDRPMRIDVGTTRR